MLYKAVARVSINFSLAQQTDIGTLLNVLCRSICILRAYGQFPFRRRPIFPAILFWSQFGYTIDYKADKAK